MPDNKPVTTPKFHVNIPNPEPVPQKPHDPAWTKEQREEWIAIKNIELGKTV